MNRGEISFWVAVGLVAIIAVSLAKVFGNLPWMPRQVRTFVNAL